MICTQKKQSNHDHLGLNKSKMGMLVIRGCGKRQCGGYGRQHYYRRRFWQNRHFRGE